MKRLTNFLIVVALVLLPVAAKCQAPYPGYWHANSVAIPHYAPCPANGLHAYTAFVDPDTGIKGYFRYDFSSYRYPITTCPGGDPAPCLFASGGGPCHCVTWADSDGYEKPIWNPSPGVDPNYFPAPNTLAPSTAPTGLCAEWIAAGNTATCPGTEDYVTSMERNPIYSAGYQLALPKINADPGCSGAGPTRTPTQHPPPTQTPTPKGPTPTPTANQYAQFIEALKAAGVSNGCGGGNFCPGSTITREQLATWLVKASGKNLVIAPCATPAAFSDVRCVTP